MEPTIVNHDVVFSERMSRNLFKIKKWVPVSQDITVIQRGHMLNMQKHRYIYIYFFLGKKIISNIFSFLEKNCCNCPTNIYHRLCKILYYII